ncbi:MAG: hypothetical protein AAB368_00300, partial [bacterium]
MSTRAVFPAAILFGFGAVAWYALHHPEALALSDAFKGAARVRDKLGGFGAFLGPWRRHLACHLAALAVLVARHTPEQVREHLTEACAILR